MRRWQWGVNFEHYPRRDSSSRAQQGLRHALVEFGVYISCLMLLIITRWSFIISISSSIIVVLSTFQLSTRIVMQRWTWKEHLCRQHRIRVIWRRRLWLWTLRIRRERTRRRRIGWNITLVLCMFIYCSWSNVRWVGWSWCIIGFAITNRRFKLCLKRRTPIWFISLFIVFVIVHLFVCGMLYFVAFTLLVYFSTILSLLQQGLCKVGRFICLKLGKSFQTINWNSTLT